MWLCFFVPSEFFTPRDYRKSELERSCQNFRCFLDIRGNKSMANNYMGPFIFAIFIMASMSSGAARLTFSTAHFRQR